MESMSNRIRSTIYIFSLIIVIITGFAAYSNSFNNEFIFDDRNTIIENPFIRKLDITQIWNMSQGRFIGFLSFALNFHFHKFEVSGFHITNLVEPHCCLSAIRFRCSQSLILSRGLPHCLHYFIYSH